MKPLTQRYQADLLGVLSCYDRMIITGTLPGACYAGGMISFLYSRHIKIFDYAKVFADPWRERIRQCAHELADAHGVSIEHVNKPHIRKEDLVAKAIERRGKHSGLVHILSAMEACSAYKPWHDKNSHKTFLRSTTGKCLHYYFYFIDEEVGLCYLRVPTWCPFRLQFYCNGHSWLENKLISNGIRRGFRASRLHWKRAFWRWPMWWRRCRLTALTAPAWAWTRHSTRSRGVRGTQLDAVAVDACLRVSKENGFAFTK